MYFIGAVCLFLLGSLTVNRASEQDCHTIYLNNLLNTNNPDGGFEEDYAELAKDPFFQTWTVEQQLVYISQLDNKELANHISITEFLMNNECTGYSEVNERLAIIDQSTPGPRFTSSNPLTQASGSGLGSGSLPFSAAQVSTQEPIYQATTNVKQPRVPKSNRAYRDTNCKEKQFGCLECPREFTRWNDLDRHKLIHTNEKPFVCKWCGTRSNRSDNLKRHQSIHGCPVQGAEGPPGNV
ncbi:hypothetical protein BJ085DRAFT_30773 [Dimargaris cristalligena]|uniref:C2H2-type domain-containing protein n=1 Tax=Dimargaris cristalligena TaxID=215637 RepID=A0A4V1J531_9FUNG|nr:hypothetical protein BJ085DRAFT_30773 [Dimargaris cristalligena]|eukprot:RKP37639.1 hypothetical protein BJ085DRAFT_30773 [Dimargaris cristalligena]